MKNEMRGQTFCEMLRDNLNDYFLNGYFKMDERYSPADFLSDFEGICESEGNKDDPCFIRCMERYGDYMEKKDEKEAFDDFIRSLDFIVQD